MLQNMLLTCVTWSIGRDIASVLRGGEMSGAEREAVAEVEAGDKCDGVIRNLDTVCIKWRKFVLQGLDLTCWQVLKLEKCRTSFRAETRSSDPYI